MHPYTVVKIASLIENKALGCILKYLASPNVVQNMRIPSNIQIWHNGLSFSSLALILIDFSIQLEKHGLK